MNAHTLLAALMALAPVAALAQGSLTERRQAIIQGTAPGKVLLERPPSAAAAAASVPAAAASGPASSAPPRQGLFSRLPPPSGRPMSAAQRLDAPDQGIVIKSAPAASAPR